MSKPVIDNTEFYIWNDNGLFQSSENLKTFCSEITLKSMFDLKESKKENYVSLSFLDDLNIKFYDDGYILFVEGKILNCILFLYEFDRYFNQNRDFYISPTQRLDEETKTLFNRGMKIEKISIFFDEMFRNKDYSKALEKVLS